MRKTPKKFFIFLFCQKGKLKVFQAGRELYENYESYLRSSNNNPEDVVNARSSASPRAIVSMQLFLAGLFQPNIDHVWNSKNFLWNPLSFTIVPTRYDKVPFLEFFKSHQKKNNFFLSFQVLQGYKCPNYRKLYMEYAKSSENQITVRNFTNLFRYLTNHTGWNIQHLEDAAFVHCALQIEVTCSL